MKRKPIVVVLLAATAIFLALYGCPRIDGSSETHSPEISPLTSVAEKMLPKLWIILISFLVAVVLAIIAAAVAGYRKNKEVKRREEEKRRSIAVTATSATATLAASPAAPGTPTTTTIVVKKKVWWNLDLDRIGKTVWRPLTLAAAVFCLVMAVALSPLGWGWDKMDIQTHPELWPIAFAVVALLILMARNNPGIWINRLLGLGLVALIVFLLLNTFGSHIGQGWDRLWHSSPIPPASPTTVDISVSVSGDTRQVRKIVAPVGRLSEETFCIPRGCWFSITAPAEVEAVARSGKKYLIGPGHNGHLGDNLKIVDSIVSFRATGTKSVVVTCEWEDK